MRILAILLDHRSGLTVKRARLLVRRTALVLPPIEVDEDTFKVLEQIAPARSRRRSPFIPAAIQKAILENQERATAEAYRRVPDSADDLARSSRLGAGAARASSPEATVKQDEIGARACHFPWGAVRSSFCRGTRPMRT